MTWMMMILNDKQWMKENIENEVDDFWWLESRYLLLENP